MICFFDTNILVYAVDWRNTNKQQAALALYAQSLGERSFAISTQVLNEFYSVVTRGVQPLLQPDQARMQISALARQRVVPMTPAITVAAMELADRYRLPWWDALVLEAALSIGSVTMYSEDFQHRQRFGELTVMNPFIA